ncbi:hypothetical protein MTY_1404 [Moorella thermoacetica Y72]|uniref:Uncharacterized protein n=1 Tax=Moorella thermoacetica Y72 TaxID=1325331 RepID=A0A0S6UE89_NEOTH|nr:hypothetical protein MTY_1404 [Moorella thermoacetica Y72]
MSVILVPQAGGTGEISKKKMASKVMSRCIIFPPTINIRQA